MEQEIWKDIEGYEGLYQVSNLGRVKRAYILKPYKDKKGYLAVQLSKHNKVKRLFVHRLVAMAFIPNPNNLPQVNHKDRNTSNNHMGNLEWCDARYNLEYSDCLNKAREGWRMPADQYTKDWVFIKHWHSMREAELSLGLHRGGISLAIRNPQRSCGGFRWKSPKPIRQYVENPTYFKSKPLNEEQRRQRLSNSLTNNPKKSKKIAQFSLDGELIRVFPSTREACRELGISNGNLIETLKGKRKTCGKYMWKYID